MGHRHRVKTAIAFALSALAPLSIRADSTPTADWQQVSTSGPSARIAPYMDYDSARGRTVLFGGAESSSVYDSDTWELQGATWTRVATSGPPAGGLGAMAFDSARGVSVLFGGGDANSTLPAVTWEWNGTTWTSRATAHAPAPRIWTAMTYDSSRHVVVLFGGAAAGGLQFNDTWEYDGSDWRQVAPNHSPPARFGLGLAFDSVRNRTVLFGGRTSSGRVNDTWEYDGNDWLQVQAPTSPAPRWIHTMAYDAALGRTVVFGGDYLIPGRLGPNNETWLYDGVTWQQLTTTDSPSARDEASGAYDFARQRLVVFGGTQEGFPPVPLGDTWQLSLPVTLSATSMDFGLQPVMSATTRSVTLTNTGAAALGISSIAAGGDFATTDNCPRSPETLAAGAACGITVTFTPSSGNGAVTGAVTVIDDAGTQTVQLSGSGQWGEVNPLQSALDFGSAPINPTGPTATAVETITFPDFPTIVTDLSAGYPFAVTGFDCPTGSVLPVGTTCHASLAFQPSSFGQYSGRLTIRANQPNPATVALSGTAIALPLTMSVGVVEAAWGHSMSVQVSTNATAGTATFTLNGTQVGAPGQLSPAGSATAMIPLNDATVPTGSGIYPLAVAVHPTDGIHADSSTSQPVTVARATEMLSWTGTALAAAGTQAQLSAVVAPPAGETQFYDFSDHPVWVRFDVSDRNGTLTTYYAQVTNSGPSGRGSATVQGAVIASGAYSVRARLVAASGSNVANAYVASEELRATYAGFPTRGGYMAGSGLDSTVAFVFTPASGGGGSLVVVLPTVVGLPDGGHDAYIVITATSVSSVGSHSHTATATGAASIAIYDAVTGTRYSDFDSTTTFRVNVYADGSVDVITSNFTVSLPPGSGVNRL
jgi:hypothetical protein